MVHCPLCNKYVFLQALLRRYCDSCRCADDVSCGRPIQYEQRVRHLQCFKSCKQLPTCLFLLEVAHCACFFQQHTFDELPSGQIRLRRVRVFLQYICVQMHSSFVGLRRGKGLRRRDGRAAGLHPAVRVSSLYSGAMLTSV